MKFMRQIIAEQLEDKDPRADRPTLATEGQDPVGTPGSDREDRLESIAAMARERPSTAPQKHTEDDPDDEIFKRLLYGDDRRDETFDELGDELGDEFAGIAEDRSDSGPADRAAGQSDAAHETDQSRQARFQDRHSSEERPIARPEPMELDDFDVDAGFVRRVRTVAARDDAPHTPDDLPPLVLDTPYKTPISGGRTDAEVRDQIAAPDMYHGLQRLAESLSNRSEAAERLDDAPAEASLADDPVAIPDPATTRTVPSAGRVKTRLLGFGGVDTTLPDPFETTPASNGAQKVSFPVGWLVIVSGPGRGTGFTLQHGVSLIGRGEDQTVCLDFGDTSISRSSHAMIAYDAEQGGFFLGHGGKANLVRLNGRPVLSTEDLASGSTIRIGETTLRFVAFCGSDFSWDAEE